MATYKKRSKTSRKKIKTKKITAHNKGLPKAGLKFFG